ncbi:MAG: hypothetical protein ABJD07_15885, partial [Gemmatimonadaceae bacterium]
MNKKRASGVEARAADAGRARSGQEPTDAATPIVASPTPEPKRPTIAHRAQYAALRTAVGALGAMSFRRAGDVGATLGMLGYRPFGVRKRVVERQIAAAFPGWSEERVDEVARAAFAHLGRVTVETALLSRLPRERVLALVGEVEGWDVIERAKAAGQGMILLTGHYGNWELAGADLVARGVPLDAGARKMNNPLF